MGEETTNQVQKYKHEELANSLAKLTAAQQAFFKTLYPKGVPDKDLASAIDLCNRTLRQNIHKPPQAKETK